MSFYNNEIKYLITAMGLLFWFKGMYRILDFYIKDTLKNNIILVIFALTLIYLSAGSLFVLGSSAKSPEEKMDDLR